MEKELPELENDFESASDDVSRLAAMLALVDHHVNDDFVEGWKLAADALELAKKLEDKASVAHAYETIGNCLWKLAEFTQALESLEIALDRYLGLGDLYGVARCYCAMGIIYGTMEQYRAALENFEEGLSASRRADRPEFAVTLTSNIGHVYFKTGRYSEAMECFNHALDYYKFIGNSHGAGNVLSGMAGIHVFQGDYSKGLELARRAMDLHKKAKQTRGIAVSMMNVGIALMKMGELEKAKVELKKALNYCRSIHLKMTEHDVLKQLSEVCAELGDAKESEHYLDLYIDAQQEEKKLSVKRKAYQFRQRQQIRELRDKS